jgi:hypothetical protein
MILLKIVSIDMGVTMYGELERMEFKMIRHISMYVVFTLWATVSEPLFRIHTPVFDLLPFWIHFHIYMIVQKCSRFVRLISHIFAS